MKNEKTPDQSVKLTNAQYKGYKNVQNLLLSLFNAQERIRSEIARNHLQEKKELQILDEESKGQETHEERNEDEQGKNRQLFAEFYR